MPIEPDYTGCCSKGHWFNDVS